MRTIVVKAGQHESELYEDRHVQIRKNGDLLICNLAGDVTDTYVKGTWDSVKTFA